MSGFFEDELAFASRLLGSYFRKCSATEKCPDIFPSGELIMEIVKLVEEGHIRDLGDLEGHVSHKIGELISCEVLLESLDENGIAIDKCEYAKSVFVRHYASWLLGLCIKLNVLGARAPWRNDMT